MAKSKINSNVSVETDITLTLSVREAHALHAIVGYGGEALIKVIYEHLGRHYLTPYEEDALILLEEIRCGLPMRIKEVENILKGVKDLRK